MVRFLGALLLAICVSSVAHAQEAAPSEQIAQAAAKWSALYAARDLDGLMTLYHDDAMLFTDGTPALRGPQAIRDYFAKSFAATAGSTIDFRIENIRVFGDVAHLVSLYKIVLDLGQGEPVMKTGRSMLVYKRDAFGHWLLFADMDNQAPDATPLAFDAAP